MVADTTTGYTRGESYHVQSIEHHNVSHSMFMHKWGHSPVEGWQKGTEKRLKQLCPSYIMYPYFERDVETLREQKYLLGGDV